MNLTRTQFEVLTAFFEREKSAGLTKFSADIVDETITRLTESGLIENGAPSAAGLSALEPYRVKRAVFLAAGFGSRMVPITINTPKPLIRVNGARIIDTLLDAVYAAGIEEALIVRGYLGEQFEPLKYKYPNVTFIENPFYNEANNISSVLCAHALLQNAYVIESDLILYNPALITKYQYTSNYLGVPTERTDDWCFETRDGVITRIRVGGENCHHMFGISYWNASDGAKLANHIKQVYDMPDGKKTYWDEVALKYFIDDYKVEVRECTFEDIVEIDTFDELKKLDEAYRAP